MALLAPPRHSSGTAAQMLLITSSGVVGQETAAAAAARQTPPSSFHPTASNRAPQRHRKLPGFFAPSCEEKATPVALKRKRAEGGGRVEEPSPRKRRKKRGEKVNEKTSPPAVSPERGLPEKLHA